MALFFANGSFTYYSNKEVIHTEAADNSDIALVSEEKINMDRLSPEEITPVAYGSGDYQIEEDEGSFTLEDIWEEHATYLENTGRNAEVEEKYTNVTFEADDWRILLVNKQHPIPDDYEFDLAVIKD